MNPRGHPQGVSPQLGFPLHFPTTPDVIKTDKPRELTAAEIEKFEADNRSRGKVQLMRFPSDVNPDRPASFWVARPGRQLLMAVAEISQKDVGKSNDMLINGCVLAGDVDQLEEDDDLYFGLTHELSTLVEAKKKL